MWLKKLFFDYIGPVLAIPGMIFSIWGLDRLLVWRGVQYAKAMCRDPGPLVIHDRQAWNEYSGLVRKSLMGEGNRDLKIVQEIRDKMGIKYEIETVRSNNILTGTFYDAIQTIKYEQIKIADLHRYGALDSAYLSYVLFSEPSTKYTCISNLPNVETYYGNYPEFF